MEDYAASKRSEEHVTGRFRFGLLSSGETLRRPRRNRCSVPRVWSPGLDLKGTPNHGLTKEAATGQEEEKPRINPLAEESLQAWTETDRHLRPKRDGGFSLGQHISDDLDART